MADRVLVVHIIGDDTSLNRAFNRSERRTKQFETRTMAVGKNIKSAFGVAGIALGSSAVFAFAKQATDAAAELNTEIIKSQQVFGDSSKDIEAWSKTTASSIGISQREALIATGTFGNFFRVLELGPATGAEMSKTLVQLAADLASINTEDPSDVLNALQAGIKGRGGGLVKYGVALSNARVAQEALNETGKKSAKTLTDQEKVLARYNIILQDTLPSQGAFADRSGDLASQQHIAAAETADLAANMGQLLAPAEQLALIATIGLVGGLNDATEAMRHLHARLHETHVFDGWNKGVEGAGSGIASFFGDIRDGIPLLDSSIAKVRELRGLVRGQFDDPTSGPSATGPQSGAAGRAAARARAAAKENQDATKDLKEARRRFAASIRGLGLKLETKGLTESEQDDLAVLREIERRIQREIRLEGRTFDLAQALVRTRRQIADKIAGISDDQERSATKKAQDTADKADREREKQKRIREQARKNRQADLLEDLGLTREGDKPTPGSGSLLARARSLQDQIKGTPLDTNKTNSQLQRIVKVLQRNFKTAGKDVRDAILSMLNDISSAMDSGKSGSSSGPLTKTTSLNSKKVLAGLGLSPEEIRNLRSRLSNFNSAGIGLSGSNSRTTGSGFSAPIVVESHIYLDGRELETSVTRRQQKTKKRNPKQKRGPNRGD